MSLSVPSNLGLSVQEQSQIEQQWGTLVLVQNHLAQMGISPLATPQFAAPQHLDPAHLSSGNSAYLTNEYARYIAYAGHVGEQTAIIDAKILELKNEMEAIESAVRRALRARNARGTKPTKEELTDECRENPRYNDLLLQEQYYEQERKILEARRDTYLRAAAVVSRAVTLRGQDIESNLRSHNLGNPVMGRDFG